MSSLEASVTLEDVFAVVEAKRVPLAPELAGYLTLEIADGSDAGGGDVDPRTVYISEEGTVALVRPKSNPAVGDAETSVRHILAKLLEASGSATPALGVAAKRKTPSGMPALVEELEAALIPVNRAAGRRALARLAREVKRVTMGVGRNALSRATAGGGASPRGGALARREAGDAGASAADLARPSRIFDDEAVTAKRPNQLADGPTHADTARTVGGVGNPRAIPAFGLTPPPAPGAPALRPGGGLPRPPAGSAGGPVSPPPRRRDPASGRATSATRDARDGVAPGNLLADDEVDNLLATFDVKAVGDREMSRDLKAIAGLDPTPPPPDATSLAELAKDVGKAPPPLLDTAANGAAAHASAAATPGAPEADDDPVAALLALADASAPLAPSVGSGGAGRASDAEGAPAAPAHLDAPPAPIGFAVAPSAGPSPIDAAPAAPAADGAPAPAPPLASGRREKLVATALGPAATRPTVRGGSGPGPRAPKTAFALLLLALIALVSVAGFIWWKAPHVFTGRKKPAAPAPTTSAPVVAPKCTVALVLTDVPSGAEILLRVGQAPVDVERMPMGTRLELVGTAEGHAPRRAVIKADAPWDKGPDGKPRIEVPMQLDPSKAKPGTLDPWPAAEPGSEVGGTGKPGTVHVVSNVRGADVWLLAGLGPEARIEQLDCKADIDVLLAGQPASLRKRLRVTEKEIRDAPADAQGNRVVTVSAK